MSYTSFKFGDNDLIVDGAPQNRNACEALNDNTTLNLMLEDKNDKHYKYELTINLDLNITENTYYFNKINLYANSTEKEYFSQNNVQAQMFQMKKYPLSLRFNIEYFKCNNLKIDLAEKKENSPKLKFKIKNFTFVYRTNDTQIETKAINCQKQSGYWLTYVIIFFFFSTFALTGIFVFIIARR